MNRIEKWTLVTSMIVLLVGASCSRRPDEEQAPASGEPRSTDANSISTNHQNKSSTLARELSAPDEVIVGTGDGSRETTVAYSAAAPSWASYLDLNSGDLHGLMSYSDGHERYGTWESRLSNAIRRLGIPIPKERNWQPISAAPSRSAGAKLVYPDVLTAAYHLLDLLDQAKAVDRDRRAILERFMTNLRTEKPLRVVENSYMLVVECADQYGLQSPFLPEYTERLRQARKQKAD